MVTARIEAGMTRSELVDADGAVSVTEAARRLGIKRTYVYSLMNRGELQYAKIGKRRVVMIAEIKRFLAAHLIGNGT